MYAVLRTRFIYCNGFVGWTLVDSRLTAIETEFQGGKGLDQVAHWRIAEGGLQARFVLLSTELGGLSDKNRRLERTETRFQEGGKVVHSSPRAAQAFALSDVSRFTFGVAGGSVLRGQPGIRKTRASYWPAEPATPLL